MSDADRGEHKRRSHSKPKRRRSKPNCEERNSRPDICSVDCEDRMLSGQDINDQRCCNAQDGGNGNWEQPSSSAPPAQCDYDESLYPCGNPNCVCYLANADSREHQRSMNDSACELTWNHGNDPVTITCEQELLRGLAPTTIETGQNENFHCCQPTPVRNNESTHQCDCKSNSSHDVQYERYDPTSAAGRSTLLDKAFLDLVESFQNLRDRIIGCPAMAQAASQPSAGTSNNTRLFMQTNLQTTKTNSAGNIQRSKTKTIKKLNKYGQMDTCVVGETIEENAPAVSKYQQATQQRQGSPTQQGESKTKCPPLGNIQHLRNKIDGQLDFPLPTFVSGNKFGCTSGTSLSKPTPTAVTCQCSHHSREVNRQQCPKCSMPPPLDENKRMQQASAAIMNEQIACMNSINLPTPCPFYGRNQPVRQNTHIKNKNRSLSCDCLNDMYDANILYNRSRSCPRGYADVNRVDSVLLRCPSVEDELSKFEKKPHKTPSCMCQDMTNSNSKRNAHSRNHGSRPQFDPSICEPPEAITGLCAHCKSRLESQKQKYSTQKSGQTCCCEPDEDVTIPLQPSQTYSQIKCTQQSPYRGSSQHLPKPSSTGECEHCKNARLADRRDCQSQTKKKPKPQEVRKMALEKKMKNFEISSLECNSAKTQNEKRRKVDRTQSPNSFGERKCERSFPTNFKETFLANESSRMDRQQRCSPADFQNNMPPSMDDYTPSGFTSFNANNYTTLPQQRDQHLPACACASGTYSEQLSSNATPNSGLNNQTTYNYSYSPPMRNAQRKEDVNIPTTFSRSPQRSTSRPMPAMNSTPNFDSCSCGLIQYTQPEPQCCCCDRLEIPSTSVGRHDRRKAAGSSNECHSQKENEQCECGAGTTYSAYNSYANPNNYSDQIGNSVNDTPSIADDSQYRRCYCADMFPSQQHANISYPPESSHKYPSTYSKPMCSCQQSLPREELEDMSMPCGLDESQMQATASGPSEEQDELATPSYCCASKTSTPHEPWLEDNTTPSSFDSCLHMLPCGRKSSKGSSKKNRPCSKKKKGKVSESTQTVELFSQESLINMTYAQFLAEVEERRGCTSDRNINSQRYKDDKNFKKSQRISKVCKAPIREKQYIDTTPDSQQYDPQCFAQQECICLCQENIERDAIAYEQPSNVYPSYDLDYYRQPSQTSFHDDTPYANQGRGICDCANKWPTGIITPSKKRRAFKQTPTSQTNFKEDSNFVNQRHPATSIKVPCSTLHKRSAQSERSHLVALEDDTIKSTFPMQSDYNTLKQAHQVVPEDDAIKPKFPTESDYGTQSGPYSSPFFPPFMPSSGQVFNPSGLFMSTAQKLDQSFIPSDTLNALKMASGEMKKSDSYVIKGFDRKVCVRTDRSVKGLTSDSNRQPGKNLPEMKSISKENLLDPEFPLHNTFKPSSIVHSSISGPDSSRPTTTTIETYERSYTIEVDEDKPTNMHEEITVTKTSFVGDESPTKTVRRSSTDIVLEATSSNLLDVIKSEVVTREELTNEIDKIASLQEIEDEPLGEAEDVDRPSYLQTTDDIQTTPSGIIQPSTSSSELEIEDAFDPGMQADSAEPRLGSSLIERTTLTQREQSITIEMKPRVSFSEDPTEFPAQPDEPSEIGGTLDDGGRISTFEVIMEEKTITQSIIDIADENKPSHSIDVPAAVADLSADMDNNANMEDLIPAVSGADGTADNVGISQYLLDLTDIVENDAHLDTVINFGSPELTPEGPITDKVPDYEEANVLGDMINIAGEIPIMEDMPFLLNEMPYVDEAMLNIGGQIPYIQGDVPYMEGDLPYMERDIPYMDGDISNMAGDMPIMDGGIPIMEGNMPIMEGNMPILEGAVPYMGDSMPNMEEVMPYVEANMPIMEEHMPYMEGDQSFMDGHIFDLNDQADPMAQMSFAGDGAFNENGEFEDDLTDMSKQSIISNIDNYGEDSPIDERTSTLNNFGELPYAEDVDSFGDDNLPNNEEIALENGDSPVDENFEIPSDMSVNTMNQKLLQSMEQLIDGISNIIALNQPLDLLPPIATLVPKGLDAAHASGMHTLASGGHRDPASDYTSSEASDLFANGRVKFADSDSTNSSCSLNRSEDEMNMDKSGITASQQELVEFCGRCGRRKKPGEPKEKHSHCHRKHHHHHGDHHKHRCHSHGHHCRSKSSHGHHSHHSHSHGHHSHRHHSHHHNKHDHDQNYPDEEHYEVLPTAVYGEFQEPETAHHHGQSGKHHHKSSHGHHAGPHHNKELIPVPYAGHLKNPCKLHQTHEAEICPSHLHHHHHGVHTTHEHDHHVQQRRSRTGARSSTTHHGAGPHTDQHRRHSSGSAGKKHSPRRPSRKGSHE